MLPPSASPRLVPEQLLLMGCDTVTTRGQERGAIGPGWGDGLWGEADTVYCNVQD